MESKDILHEIFEFRKTHKDCVNTEHTMTLDEFLSVAVELKKKFKKFVADFNDKGVTVKIERYIR